LEALTILLIAIGLSMDTFAVSLGIGTSQRCNSLRSSLRLIWHLSLFQGGLTLAGWAAGATVQRYLANYDHWIIFALLLFVGGRMLKEGFDPNHDNSQGSDPSRGATLILLSVATSLDATAVGLSLAIMRLNVIFSILTIWLATVIFAAIGLLTGNSLGKRFGKRMEILGGLILIAIGVRVLVEHLVLLPAIS